MSCHTVDKIDKVSQSVRKGVGMGMLYDLQNKIVSSLRLKVWVLLVEMRRLLGTIIGRPIIGHCLIGASLLASLANVKWESVFQALVAAMLKSCSPKLKS